MGFNKSTLVESVECPSIHFVQEPDNGYYLTYDSMVIIVLGTVEISGGIRHRCLACEIQARRWFFASSSPSCLRFLGLYFRLS